MAAAERFRTVGGQASAPVRVAGREAIGMRLGERVAGSQAWLANWGGAGGGGRLRRHRGAPTGGGRSGRHGGQHRALGLAGAAGHR